MPSEGLVGLDLRMWNHAGIGRYIRELFGAMFRLEDPNRFTVLAYGEDEESIKTVMNGGQFVRARSKIYSLEEQAEVFKFSREVSLLHVPHFNAPFFCHSRLVVTIHDLIYLKENRFSGSVFAKGYVRGLISGVEKNSGAVIAVSDFTRRDIEKSFPRLSGRISVIHEAASSVFRAGERAVERDLISKFGLSGEYVLFVGSLKAHKNIPVLLDALESIIKSGVSAQLAIVGRKDLKETALLERIKNSGSFVRYLGEQSDDNLALLYQGARALVIPSLWEGFGLTAVEAMACGTPVISSDRASLPEVVGDAGLLFDPENQEQLVEHLVNVFQDDELRNVLSCKGLERTKVFSWDNAARKTFALYQKVLS